MPLVNVVVCICLALALSACNPAYLKQAAAGQLEILRAREPVTKVVSDPATDPALRAKLQLATEALRFAHEQLRLPDNGSYRDYANLERPYVVWNVFAAPALSLQLRRWCFPVAGCVVYRGYFAETDAHEFAERLAAQGDDVYVGGATAYSTLGFFRDPLLGSVARLPDTAVAALLFHELAHQRLYVGGDTVFDESFATLVEEEGLVRWLQSRGETVELCRVLRGMERESAVRRLVADTRARLRNLYLSTTSPDEQRAAKTAEIDGLRAAYRELRAGWREPPYFDGWFAGPLNNATLGALAAYDQLVGTLRVMLEGEGGDLEAFYRRAQRLGRLNTADRAEVLAQITSPSALQVPAYCRADARPPAPK